MFSIWSKYFFIFNDWFVVSTIVLLIVLGGFLNLLLVGELSNVPELMALADVNFWSRGINYDFC